MPCSMTAFASTNAVFPWGLATWEIRSVNHRYLETVFRLPENIRDIEMPLRELTRQKLHRGKLDSSLQIKLNHANYRLNVNLELAQQYIDASQQVAVLLNDAKPISTNDILQVPGILEEPQTNPEAMKADLINLFKESLDKLISDRSREGVELANMVNSRLEAIDQQTALIRKAMPEIIANQQQKIIDKLDSIKTEINQERLEQELVLIAQKADVEEELDRLVTHTEEIRKTLKQKDAIGRRLDFLMQELNREANTLGSKSIATVSTLTSVEMKVLIEQMREQIQNIE